MFSFISKYFALFVDKNNFFLAYTTVFDCFRNVATDCVEFTNCENSYLGVFLFLIFYIKLAFGVFHQDESDRRGTTLARPATVPVMILPHLAIRPE